MIQIETGYTGTAYQLTNPRIGDSPFGGTVLASSETTGFEGVNADNEKTWTYWKPTTTTSSWQMTFSATRTVNYCGIASHNIGSVGAQAMVQEWNGASWVTVKAFYPTDDSPILFLFANRTTDRMRVRFTDAAPTIGVIWFGRVIEFPQKAQWTGSIPFNEVSATVYTDSVSDGGHVLERFATRKAGTCNMEVQNLSETWVAANIPGLKTHMESMPVFIADRPSAYPKSVAFGMASEPIQSPRARPVLGAARTLNFSILANEPA